MRFFGKSATFFSSILLIAAAAQAAGIDYKDLRRAVGREDDVRVDAQLVRDVASANNTIGVTYQIENLTNTPIAVADKICDADYDPESRTITLSVGAEVPTNGTMPHLVTIGPGQKKTFTAGATPHVPDAPRNRFSAVPRWVQVKVNILRNLAPFKDLLATQPAAGKPPVVLSDAQFDAWLQSNDSVVLNSLPIEWKSGSNAMGSADEREPPPMPGHGHDSSF